MNLNDIKRIGLNASILTDEEKIIVNFLLNKGLEFCSNNYMIEIKEKNEIILNSNGENISLRADNKAITIFNKDICIEIDSDVENKIYSLKGSKSVNGVCETKKIEINNSNNLALDYFYTNDEYSFNCLVKTAGIHHQKKYYIESDIKGASTKKKRLDYIPTDIAEQGYEDIYFLKEIYDYIENVKEQDIEKYNNPEKKLIKKTIKKA